MVKAWYSKVRDTELIDGSVRADYVVAFETDNFELKRKVEKYLQGIMDEAEQTEPCEDWICNTCKYHTIERAVQCKMCGDGGQYEPKQTENSSEKPNNCEWSVEYAKEMLDTMPCEECGHWEHGAHNHYYCALLEMRQECCFEPKDESTLMFANKPKDEPQTDCAWK